MCVSSGSWVHGLFCGGSAAGGGGDCWVPVRQENSVRSCGCRQYLAVVKRRFVESVGSCLHSLSPRRVHAVTLDGFMVKMICLIFAHNLNLLLKGVPVADPRPHLHVEIIWRRHLPEPLRAQKAFAAQGWVCGRHREPIDYGNASGAGTRFGREMVSPVARQGASASGTHGVFGAVVAVSRRRVQWSGCGVDGSSTDSIAVYRLPLPIRSVTSRATSAG